MTLSSHLRLSCPFVGTVVLAAVGLTATPSHAGLLGVHPTTLRVQVFNDFDSGTFLLDGDDLKNGDFSYVRGPDNPFTGGSETWNVEWDLLASPSFDPDASLQGGFVVRNNASITLEFDLWLTMPLLGDAGPEMFFGSAGLTVEGGVLRQHGSVWEALIDDAVAGQLFTGNPYILDGTNGTNDDNGSIFGEHGGATDSISIHLSFDLTAGADMTATFGFGMLPAPSALALLGLGGLFGRRRRRD